MNFTTNPEIDSALGLADEADEIAATAETFQAAVREIEQRINAGKISRDERTDLGGDLLALAETLTNYALRVLA